MTQASIDAGAASVRRPHRWAAAIEVITRRCTAEAEAQAGGREVCTRCGCLCRPYEICPGCRARALTDRRTA